MKKVREVIAYLNQKDKQNEIIENIIIEAKALPVCTNFDPRKVIGRAFKENIKIKGNKVIAEIELVDEFKTKGVVFRIAGRNLEMVYDRETDIRHIKKVELLSIGAILKEMDVY